MAEETVTLREYCETRFTAIENTAHDRVASSDRALETARQELRAWQAAHNDLQRQMSAREKDFINRNDHNDMMERVNRQGNQIAMGIGILMCVQVLIGILVAVFLRKT